MLDKTFNDLDLKRKIFFKNFKKWKERFFSLSIIIMEIFIDIAFIKIRPILPISIFKDYNPYSHWYNILKIYFSIINSLNALDHMMQQKYDMLLYFQGGARQVETCACVRTAVESWWWKWVWTNSPTPWVGLPPSDFSWEGMFILGWKKYAAAQGHPLGLLQKALLVAMWR